MTRLIVVMTVIIALSFLASVVLVHRSTSRAFIEANMDISDGSPLPDHVEIARALGDAFAAGGWSAVQDAVATPGSYGLGDGASFLVVDAALGVVAAAGPPLASATVVRESAGALRVAAVGKARGQIREIDITVANPLPILAGDGEVAGYLVPLPTPVDATEASRFALGVWRSVAGWLVLVVLVTMAATVLVVRQSLRPIGRLASAARELQNGNVPVRIMPSGSSEFRPLVAAFNSAAESLSRTAEIRRRLVSDVAHELRTPVTNLKGQLEALEAGLIPPDRDFTSTLAAELRLLERLIEDFQQLALTDAGQMRLDLQDIRLRDVLEGILVPLADAAGAEVMIDMRDDLVVRADEERIRQVLSNLMENAIRHKPVDLRIHVTGEFDEHSVSVVFSDNGPGIAKKDQPFIFERFYRAEKSRNRATGGSGLGLAIVKGIVEAMDGTVRYHDRESGGATFVVTMPRSIPKA